jgi:pSer/pThr/pTyr-binding forkhead associated (FHA) protein
MVPSNWHGIRPSPSVAIFSRRRDRLEAIMNSTVTLIVTRGPLAGHKFTFAEAATCMIGRSRDCTIALPLELEHLDVSRHHCTLDIAPPNLCVRDLGSLNGTFVNGRKIGQRGMRQQGCGDDTIPYPAVALSEGDEIQLGEHTAFRVCIFCPEREDSARTHRRSSGELRFEEATP